MRTEGCTWTLPSIFFEGKKALCDTPYGQKADSSDHFHGSDFVFPHNLCSRNGAKDCSGCLAGHWTEGRLELCGGLTEGSG